jgi:selenocysteine lyase/cysteine desulfurase
MAGSDGPKPLSGHPNRKVRIFPHRLEAGTLDLLGVIGLSGGLDFVMATNIGKIYQHEIALLTRLHDSLFLLDGMEPYCSIRLSKI